MKFDHPAARWSVLFIVWALQGVLSLWQFASFPSDADYPLMFGLSAARLAGISSFLLWILINLAFAFFSLHNSDRLTGRLEELFFSRSGDVLLVLSLLIAMSSQAGLWILRGLSQHREIFAYQAYADRLAPFLNLSTLVGLETIAWVIYYKRRIFLSIKVTGMDLFRRAALLWVGLGFVAAFIVVTGLGIVPDISGDWGYPGVPLLEWQILLVCILCALMLIFESNQLLSKFRRTDLWISVSIWLLAALLWLSQPIVPGFSALAPRPPNNEIYPFADSQLYDEYAQSVLIGNGLKQTGIPTKPLYVVFLAFLHLLSGQKYEHVIAVQSLILATFPVVLYWIGKDFYGRPVGLAVALLAILRDMTSNISAPFTHALSYSRLFLSEIPVAILIALFIFLSYRWARSNYPRLPAFLAGGILGMGIMIRTQAGVALPVILIMAGVANRKAFYPILRGGILMAAGIALVVSPWIWRNWNLTGVFLFDDPSTQMANLALRYNNLNGVRADLSLHAGESHADFNRRLFLQFREAVAANPGGALQALTNRFFNNCVDNILLLPLRNDLSGLSELLQPTRPFWEHWYGQPTLGQCGVLAFYILLLGLGLAAAWKRLGLWGFAPFAVNLLSNLWIAVALLSGQRFLLPMDWSIYLYYMIGLLVLVSGFLYLLERARPRVTAWYQSHSDVETNLLANNPRWFAYILAGVAFFLIGSSIPLSERIFPRRYPALHQAQIFQQLSSSRTFSKSHLDAACVQQVITDNQLTGYTGRALSPRFYGAGEGESTAKQGYAPSDQSRLVFQSIGNRYSVVILDLAEAPEFFPHAADVLFYMDPQQTNHAGIVLVALQNKEGLYLSDDLLSTNLCLQEK